MRLSAYVLDHEVTELDEGSLVERLGEDVGDPPVGCSTRPVGWSSRAVRTDSPTHGPTRLTGPRSRHLGFARAFECAGAGCAPLQRHSGRRSTSSRSVGRASCSGDSGTAARECAAQATLDLVGSQDRLNRHAAARSCSISTWGCQVAGSSCPARPGAAPSGVHPPSRRPALARGASDCKVALAGRVAAAAKG